VRPFGAANEVSVGVGMQYKIEVQDETGIWTDVRGSDGKILVYDDEGAARAALAERYPILVQMEKYAGGKRTRVVRVFRSDEEWKDGTAPK
jgi:hypothetical protein